VGKDNREAELRHTGKWHEVGTEGMGSWSGREPIAGIFFALVRD